MSNQDFENGKYGGPASDTTEYKKGRDQRMLREDAEMRAQLRASLSSHSPQSVTQTDAPFFCDPTPRAASRPAVRRPPTKTPLQKAWDDNPVRCIMAFAIPLAVSAFIIWPLLAMTGALQVAVWLGGFPYNGYFAEVFGYGAPAIFLLYGSCMLAEWRIARRTRPKRAADGAVVAGRPFARKTQK
ncbi:hypothetical protein [Mesorhizobium sophorae]|uniref:hypothetical protein n=1 Tax=Mesorhizobium sophorae TaxID=1300294 RepID=UPI000BA2CB72|nr:hypothetical protein [Mesorhizobium sophorae]